MFLMYADESGDYGVNNSPTPIVVLSGLIVHESQWRSCLQRFIDFRGDLKKWSGLPIREEIHAAKLLAKPGALSTIPKHVRLAIIRAFADLLGSTPGLSVINIIVEKSGKHSSQEVFETAWQTLIQRFENTLARQNFPDSRAAGTGGSNGILLPDQTDNKRLRALLRKMRRYNPVPNQFDFGPGSRNMPLKTIIEDPNFRDSRDSFFIQAADLIAFLLYQHEHPNTYMIEKSGQNYFKRIEPILCKFASSTNKFGIVRR